MEETAFPLRAADAGADETDLVARARTGNLPAFEEIVRRHQRRVYAVAWRIVRRHDVADDVVQESFMRAYRSLDRFETGRPFGPWIARIAANLAVSHLRSPVAREEELPEGYGETAADSPGPLAGLLGAEAQQVLDTAVGALSPEQRAVFVLRVNEELSYREIAETLGLSIGTVMSRLSRARERLRGAVLPYLRGGSAQREGGEA
jgi:RNA polymerase sigma-70 factor (ECF subfamily)